jgi:hypothetical protein
LIATHKDGSSFLADLELLTPNRKAFMKLVSLKMQRSRRSAKLEPTDAPHQIRTYAELRQQIHDDLRVQHPEWIQPDGNSPMCDSYEARLMQVLNSMTERASKKSIVDPRRLLEQGAT